MHLKSEGLVSGYSVLPGGQHDGVRYRLFPVLRGSLAVASPRNALLKEGTPTQLPSFNSAECTAFSSLISEVSSALVLALLRPGLPYSVETDARAHILGAVLFQTHDDETRKPVGVFFRSLTDAERNFSTYE